MDTKLFYIKIIYIEKFNIYPPHLDSLILSILYIYFLILFLFSITCIYYYSNTTTILIDNYYMTRRL
jgi:hypothetical protein